MPSAVVLPALQHHHHHHPHTLHSRATSTNSTNSSTSSTSSSAMSKITDPVQMLQSAAKSLYWWKQRRGQHYNHHHHPPNHHQHHPRSPSHRLSSSMPSSPTSPNSTSSSGASFPASSSLHWRRALKQYAQPRRLLWNILGLFVVAYALLTLKVLHQQQLQSQDEHEAYTDPDGGGGYPSYLEASAAAAAAAAATYGTVFQNSTVGAPLCMPLTSPDAVSYTLVTQTSANRLWMMQDHCERWGIHRPLSVAVYSTDPDDTLPALTKKLQRLGCDPNSLSVQLLADPNSTMSEYPINVLRNMAIRAVKTTHLVYIDMDFWPSTDLYDNLMQPNVRAHLASDDRTALVIPAFMYLNWCPNKSCRPNVPHNRSELLPLLSSKRHPKVTRFDRKNSAAHGTTRYREWSTTQTRRDLISIPCTESNRYEPYLVVRWCEKLPPFQEAFTGYGKNKISWILHLRRAGWKLTQLGGSFVVHYPHTPSEARVAWDGGPKSSRRSQKRHNPHRVIALPNAEELARFATDQRFVQFKHWLSEQVPDRMRLPACDSADNDDSRLWLKKPASSGEGDNGTPPATTTTTTTQTEAATTTTTAKAILPAATSATKVAASESSNAATATKSATTIASTNKAATAATKSVASRLRRK